MSSAVKKFNNDELVELLYKAREKNLRLGITGMLLYKDGNLIQALEGDKSVVLNLYATIKADPRHGWKIILLEEEIEKPVFGNWSMGFRNLSDPHVQELPGYTGFMNNTLNFERFKDDPSGALELLELFRKH
jgi:hypothetical protein